MVNRKRKMISAALSTALVVTMLLTASSTVDAQGTQPAKTAGEKKVEVIK
ncbi:hypothetical protein ABN764_20310 [Paenibacillaceae sp. P-4]